MRRLSEKIRYLHCYYFMLTQPFFRLEISCHFLILDDSSFNKGELLLLTALAGQILYESLVVQAFRPDNLHAMLRKYVLAVMGDNFLHVAEQELDMVNIVENEVILFSFKKGLGIF